MVHVDRVARVVDGVDVGFDRILDRDVLDGLLGLRLAAADKQREQQGSEDREDAIEGARHAHPPLKGRSGEP
jgi:hypothetical protein